MLLYAAATEGTNTARNEEYLDRYHSLTILGRREMDLRLWKLCAT